jgi:hypothetical protein
VALARQPFFKASKMVLAMAENNLVIGHLSSNGIANIYYVLRKAGDDENARSFLSRIIKYLTVTAINHQNVLGAPHGDCPNEIPEWQRAGV